MADKIFENNQVSIMGEIVSDFRFSHEVYGEGFYMVDVAVNRLSNYLDYIPLMISERLIDVNADYIGQIIYVTGQFRSFNRHEEKKNRLVLSVFVRELEFLEELQEDMKSNQIFLDGYICKEPIYRKTPLGREIADAIKKQKDFHIIKEKDYVKNPKKSGYQSIHVIAGVPVTYNDTVTEIRVEIQIRSFAMDYWAELDTQMCYKKDAGQIANVERETRGYSDVIAKVDNKMLELRQQIEMM